MKLGKLFLAGVIALGLMACNKEEVPDLTGEKDASISIKVFPSSNGPSVRLTGDLSGDGISTPGLEAESAIKNVEVWVFAGDVLDGYKKGADNAVEVTDIQATAGTGRTIVVVANGDIGTVSSLAAMKAKVRALGQTTDEGLVMTAIVEDLELKTGKNQYGYAEEAPDINNLSTTKLPLIRINARVALVGLSYVFTDLPYDKFVLTEVAMFNARECSKLFGTSLVAKGSDFESVDFLYGLLTGGTKYPSSGSSYVGSDGYPTGGFTADGWSALVQSFTQNAELTAPALVNAKNAHYFYAFENGANTAANEGTFIVLKGKLFNGDNQYINPGLHTDADGFTYYPIWVNAAKDGYTYNGGHTADGKIMRNTQYNITATLKKAGNPTIDPPVEAQLDVYVEVAPWIVVTQNVEW